jgi:hypothetical protein
MALLQVEVILLISMTIDQPMLSRRSILPNTRMMADYALHLMIATPKLRLTVIWTVKVTNEGTVGKEEVFQIHIHQVSPKMTTTNTVSQEFALQIEGALERSRST